MLLTPGYRVPGKIRSLERNSNLRHLREWSKFVPFHWQSPLGLKNFSAVAPGDMGSLTSKCTIDKGVTTDSPLTVPVLLSERL